MRVTLSQMFEDEWRYVSTIASMKSAVFDVAAVRSPHQLPGAQVSRRLLALALIWHRCTVGLDGYSGAGRLILVRFHEARQAEFIYAQVLPSEVNLVSSKM